MRGRPAPLNCGSACPTIRQFASSHFDVEVSPMLYRPLALAALTALVAMTAHAQAPKTIGSIERLDPAFDKLISPGTTIEVLGSGFDWAEGCCWLKDKGILVWSDIP